MERMSFPGQIDGKDGIVTELQKTGVSRNKFDAAV